MIHTITLNPSIDYYIRVDNIKLGDINRFDEYYYVAAGKGINCSKVLDLLSVDSNAIYFSGNSTGKYIDRHLKSYPHISTCPIENLEGATRINVKVIGNNETAFNSVGPDIDKQAKEDLLKMIDTFKEGDYTIISGSLPRNVDIEYVKQICLKAKEINTKVILDVPNIKIDDLKDLSVYLIKPNIDEFRYMLDNDQIHFGNYREYVSALHEANVENVLLSLGNKGAYFSGNDKRYEVTTPKVELYTSVGAGDSLLASFVGKIATGSSVEQALKYSGAVAAAMVMSEDLPSLELIENVLSQINLIEDR